MQRYVCNAKAALEKSRQKIATLFDVSPSEILFSSGGTEGNNVLLRGIIGVMQITHVLTSSSEHLAVRMPLEALVKQGKIKLSYLRVNQTGDFKLDEVEQWLKGHPRQLWTR